MRWTRLLRRRPKPTREHSERPAQTPGQKEAESALTRSKEARREVQAQRSAVTRIASRLASERERNHFAEMFRSALEGGHH